MFPCSLLLSWAVFVGKLSGLIKSKLAVHTEKAMATVSSTLAWKIPWTEEPRGLQSMGSRRVRLD